MSKFLQEFRRMQSSTHEDQWIASSCLNISERQAKKSTMVNSAFENQKKALYAASRKRAQKVSHNGRQHLFGSYSICHFSNSRTSDVSVMLSLFGTIKAFA
ncbi:hypothetical protein PM082_013545 [Marasmius tenuissimus]|nr:hypothetical protein PM082_013545 [Marasmius tenuissimus]